MPTPWKATLVATIVGEASECNCRILSSIVDRPLAVSKIVRKYVGEGTPRILPVREHLGIVNCCIGRLWLGLSERVRRFDRLALIPIYGVTSTCVRLVVVSVSMSVQISTGNVYDDFRWLGHNLWDIDVIVDASAAVEKVCKPYEQDSNVPEESSTSPREVVVYGVVEASNEPSETHNGEEGHQKR